MKNWRALFWYFLWLVCFPATVIYANIIDNSVNQPTFPPAGLILLATVNASPDRNSITIQNQSADSIDVWRDTNCTGTELSLILLAPISAASQGGSWSSDSFKGCVRIYGLAGDQIAIYQD